MLPKDIKKAQSIRQCIVFAQVQHLTMAYSDLQRAHAKNVVLDLTKNDVKRVLLNHAEPEKRVFHII